MWARDNQLPPTHEEWDYWFFMAGRGSGKTRAGSEWVRDQVENKGVSRVALVGPTAADVRDVMIEGSSGIIPCSSDDCRPTYEPSKRRLIWPNGATAMMYSAEEPERLRGPQHEKCWADEISSWAQEETWDMLQFGMRLGSHPQTVITSTPKPTMFVKKLIKLPGMVLSRGSTFDNKRHLPKNFLDNIISRYQGTRLGKQEIEGLYLEDIEGAIFSEGDILQRKARPFEEYARICIAIDPAVSADENSDLTGIIAAGVLDDDTADVLEDASGRYKPHEWASKVGKLFRKYKADMVIGEVNNGGDLVEHTLRTTPGGLALPFRSLHSSRGKRLRAEPVGALYEQHRIFHTQRFEELEEQMVTFNPEEGESPDRVDALVFALTYLIVERRIPRVRFLHARQVA